MFRKFKIAAIMAIAVLVLLIPINVYADDTIREDYQVETEDGAVFILTYRKLDDGTLEFEKHEQIKFVTPKDDNDFPAEDGEGPYFDSWKNVTLNENEELHDTPFFEVYFFKDDGSFYYMEGVQIYIIDTEKKTVRYAGKDIFWLKEVDRSESKSDEAGCEDPDYADDEFIIEEEFIEYDDSAEEETIDHYVVAEDGANGYIRFYTDGSIWGYEINSSEPVDIYDFPEYQGGTGTYYSSAKEIPLGENQVLCEVEYSAYLENVGWSLGKKFYIVDYENKTLTYAGHAEEQFICNEPPEHGSSDAPAGTADGGIPASDGVTVPANTGNSSTSAIVAAIALGAIFFSKKVK